MDYKINQTPLGHYRLVAVKGVEPLRDYKRADALLRARIGAGTQPLLAAPRFAPNGTAVDWIAEGFRERPRPLSELTGEERDRYNRQLQDVAVALRGNMPAPDDDAYPLLQSVAQLPGEDCIFCGDGRVLISGWGLRPIGDRPMGLNLLTTVPTPDTSDLTDTSDKSDKSDQADQADQVDQSDQSDQSAPPVPPVPPVPPLPPDVPDVSERSDLPHTPELSPIPAKQRRFPWWLIVALALLALMILLFLLLRNCEGSQRLADLSPVAPPPTQNEVIVAPDSLHNVVGDRLNIYVLKGGTLDDFIAAFRGKYPDKQKYDLVNPDTTLHRLVLICPQDELEQLRTGLPDQMAPEFEIVALYETVYQAQATPPDPAFNDTRQSYYLQMVDAPQAWDIERGKSDVIVAVIDGGFDLSQPELAGKIVDPYDAVSHTTQVPNVAECEGHGTHVAATAVGNAANGMGACGTAPGCRLMPVNVFVPGGFTYDSAIVDGIMYAVTKGADVINLSLGPEQGPLLKMMPEDQQEEMATNYDVDAARMWDKIYNYCQEHGVTVIKAAGNSNVLAGLDAMCRSEHVLVVSAVGPQGEQAIFDPLTQDGSNYGPLCRISAPGLDIYSALPGGQFGFMSGTSMSSPMVAGGAALLKSHDPALTPAQIRERLITTAYTARTPDIGPIMNMAAALQNRRSMPGLTPGPSPTPTPTPSNPGNNPYRDRYNELQRQLQLIQNQLEELVRQHPDVVNP